MPTEAVTIYQVSEHADPRGFSVFVINTSGPVVTTTNQFAASLCQRAKAADRRVRLTWHHEWPRKKYLDYVELEPDAAVVS